MGQVRRIGAGILGDDPADQDAGRAAGPLGLAIGKGGAFDMPPGIGFATVVNDASPAEGAARLLAALQPESAAR